MSNAPSYNAGMFSGMDYNSLMNNPYLYYAMMSPNLNFKAAQENKATNENAEAASNDASNNGAAVDYAATQPDESNTGMWVTGAIGAAALIACMAKGGGNPIKGAKALYQKFFKSAESKTSEAAKTALEKMQAVKNGRGEIKLNVPNKTKTFAGKNIQSGVNEYGIQQAVSESRLAFNPEISSARSFHITTPENNYTVFIKDGEITKVMSAKRGEGDVLARLADAEAGSSDAKILERFKKIAEELGKTSEEVDKSVLQGVKNIRYSNQYGDDTLNMVMSEYGKEPKLQTFKTLEQFDKNAEAVKAYVPSASEETFVGDIVNQTGSWLTKKGVLADGLGVLKCDQEIVNGTRCFFEGDKLVKVVQGENTYEEGSFGFIDFVRKNEKAIEQFKKDVFVDKIAAKIPVGSIIGTV